MVKKVKNTLSGAVKKVLKHHPYMEEFLREGCVNYSGLARKIMPQVKQITGKPVVKKEAVIMSIMRYVQNLQEGGLPKEVLQVVGQGSINIKTDMVAIELPKSPYNIQVLTSVQEKIDWGRGEEIIIINGISALLVVIERRNVGLLKEKIGDEFSEVFPCAARIAVHTPRELNAPGIVHYLTKPLARAGINVEVHTLVSETIFLMDEKYATEVFELLKTLIDTAREMGCGE